MRRRILATSALAAAVLLVGGGAAAYAGTPEGGDGGTSPPTIRAYACKDGTVTLLDAVPAEPAPAGTWFRAPAEPGAAVPRFETVPAQPVGPGRTGEAVGPTATVISPDATATGVPVTGPPPVGACMVKPPPERAEPAR